MDGVITAAGCVHPHIVGRGSREPGDSSHPSSPGTGGHTGRLYCHDKRLKRRFQRKSEKNRKEKREKKEKGRGNDR